MKNLAYFACLTFFLLVSCRSLPENDFWWNDCICQIHNPGGRKNHFRISCDVAKFGEKDVPYRGFFPSSIIEKAVAPDSIWTNQGEFPNEFWDVHFISQKPFSIVKDAIEKETKN